MTSSTLPSRNERAELTDAELARSHFGMAYGPEACRAAANAATRKALSLLSETTCRDAVIEECAVALDQAEEAAAAPHTFVDAIRALKGRSDVASTGKPDPSLSDMATALESISESRPELYDSERFWLREAAAVLIGLASTSS